MWKQSLLLETDRLYSLVQYHQFPELRLVGDRAFPFVIISYAIYRGKGCLQVQLAVLAKLPCQTERRSLFES
jgi:hypothetical protein